MTQTNHLVEPFLPVSVSKAMMQQEKLWLFFTGRQAKRVSGLFGFEPHRSGWMTVESNTMEYDELARWVLAKLGRSVHYIDDSQCDQITKRCNHRAIGCMAIALVDYDNIDVEVHKIPEGVLWAYEYRRTRRQIGAF